VDACKTDALDQWCSRTTLLGLKWHQFVHNDEVRRITKQPNHSDNPVTASFFVWARMDDDADAKMILTEETTSAISHHMVEQRREI